MKKTNAIGITTESMRKKSLDILNLFSCERTTILMFGDLHSGWWFVHMVRESTTKPRMPILACIVQHLIDQLKWIHTSRINNQPVIEAEIKTKSETQRCDLH